MADCFTKLICLSKCLGGPDFSNYKANHGVGITRQKLSELSKDPVFIDFVDWICEDINLDSIFDPIDIVNYRNLGHKNQDKILFKNNLSTNDLKTLKFSSLEDIRLQYSNVKASLDREKSLKAVLDDRLNVLMDGIKNLNMSSSCVDFQIEEGTESLKLFESKYDCNREKLNQCITRIGKIIQEVFSDSVCLSGAKNENLKSLKISHFKLFRDIEFFLNIDIRKLSAKLDDSVKPLLENSYSIIRSFSGGQNTNFSSCDIKIDLSFIANTSIFKDLSLFTNSFVKIKQKLIGVECESFGIIKVIAYMDEFLSQESIFYFLNENLLSLDCRKSLKSANSKYNNILLSEIPEYIGKYFKFFYASSLDRSATFILENLQSTDNLLSKAENRYIELLQYISIQSSFLETLSSQHDTLLSQFAKIQHSLSINSTTFNKDRIAKDSTINFKQLIKDLKLFTPDSSSKWLCVDEHIGTPKYFHNEYSSLEIDSYASLLLESLRTILENISESCSLKDPRPYFSSEKIVSSINDILACGNKLQDSYKALLTSFNFKLKNVDNVNRSWPAKIFLEKLTRQ